MEFTILGHKLDLSDELIKEYLSRTNVREESLELNLEIQLEYVLHNRDSFGNDLNKAVETAIRDELDMWESK